MPNEKKIPGGLIKKGLDSLNFLGLAIKDMIIEHVEESGFVLDNRHAYDLKEIEASLENILGAEAADLIIKRVKHAINGQK